MIVEFGVKGMHVRFHEPGESFEIGEFDRGV